MLKSEYQYMALYNTDTEHRVRIMSSVERKVSRIEILVYGSATDSRQWAVFLNALKEHLEASTILPSKTDFNYYESGISHSVSINYKIVLNHEDWSVHLTPWLRDIILQVQVRRVKDILFPKNFINSNFYKEWLLLQGIFYSVFAALRK